MQDARYKIPDARYTRQHDVFSHRREFCALRTAGKIVGARVHAHVHVHVHVEVAQEWVDVPGALTIAAGPLAL